jgi:hypothetical protein
MPVEIIILSRLHPYFSWPAKHCSTCEPTRMRAHSREPAKALLAVK